MIECLLQRFDVHIELFLMYLDFRISWQYLLAANIEMALITRAENCALDGRRVEALRGVEALRVVEEMFSLPPDGVA